jgi:hypothetical protein
VNPEAIIDTYVTDVVRRLPRKQRADVAFELRSLLAEELQGRADDTGRSADAAMTMDLLAEFGRPMDVADRYRPAGFTIIRPADAPGFARVSLIGVALQWVVSLVAVYSVPMDAGAPGGDWLSRLGSWWLTWGLGSFWWPGFLVSASIVAAVVSTRRVPKVKPPLAILDRDRVSRPLIVLYMALAAVGSAPLIAIPSIATWGSALPEPVVEAFTLDAEFLAYRAPWALLLWAAALGLVAALLVAGRWTRAIRIAAAVGDVVWIGLLAWWVAGPIFVTEAAYETTRAILALLAIGIVVDLVFTVRRIARPIAAPVLESS